MSATGNEYGDWRPPSMPDNSRMRMVGQVAHGGLIWNTAAVSYPVPLPDIEVRSLQNFEVAGTGLKPPDSAWQVDFMRGYRGRARSVMKEPAPTAETMGHYSGAIPQKRDL